MTLCPTVTAINTHQYREQIERIQDFSHSMHIDYMDGVFVDTKSPGIAQFWWPKGTKVHLHLMCEYPSQVIKQAIKLSPALIIIHAEADMSGAVEALNDLQKIPQIKSGVALLQDTDPEDDDVYGLLSLADHVLVFSGNLGHHGGKADLKLLEKVVKIKKMFPDIEVGWDGGINDKNAQALSRGGVDVLNIGGFIQKSSDPRQSYQDIQSALL